MLILIVSNSYSQNYTPAVNKIAEALYVDSELKYNIEYKLEIYKQKVPKQLKPAFDLIIPLTDILFKRRIELTWELK
jgi:hypothetical protein